jgi:hypothetical protein
VSIRVVLSFHLRALAHSGEVALDGVDTGIRPGPRNARAGRGHSQKNETRYPMLRGSIPKSRKIGEIWRRRWVRQDNQVCPLNSSLF